MNIKKITACAVALSMTLSSAAALAAERPQKGDNLKVIQGYGDDLTSESSSETYDLYSKRPETLRPMEKLGRGAVAVHMGVGSYVYLSWRWLGTESVGVKFNVYRDGKLLNSEPLNATNFIDLDGFAAIASSNSEPYKIVPVVDGTEQTDKAETVGFWHNNYIDIPIQKPDDNEVKGEKYTYSAGDASVGDLDGDGEYEIVLKWDPSNAKDAAQGGFTGECIIDAYKMDGTQLWRINLGPNIRSGQHDTQFMVYDFDCDGKAEVAMRTADGTVAGDGSVIGDADKNYAVVNDGKNLTGPLYLTVFKGEDGSVIDTVDYYPQTTGQTKNGKKWDVKTWGDGFGNRSERYLAAVGYLDGTRPSMIFCRGYYTGPEGDAGGRTVIAAFDLADGKIKEHWIFDTLNYNNKYIGQGNHSMSVADVDYDGCDEIIYGSLAIDHDGKPLYSTGLGHGDAQHVGNLVPDRTGLEVYSCHEDTGSDYGYEMRDARTGEILFGAYTGTDNGRACAGDIDPRYRGAESWSAAGIMTAADGTVISDSYVAPTNFMCYWDGDLGREILDNIYVSKWNYETEKAETIFTATGCNSVNGTKSTPALSADLFGDWREELVYPTKDGSALRIFTTTEPTPYRIPTLMHDIQYRMHIAYQNTCYNQPPHVSYYLGYDTSNIPVPKMYSVGDNAKNPDMDGWMPNDHWDILSALYSGEKVELAIDTPTAVVNGVPMRIDNNNTEVVPVIDENDRTLVPLRFIAEAFGAEVGWDADTKTVSIKTGTKPSDTEADRQSGRSFPGELKLVIGEKTIKVTSDIYNGGVGITLDENGNEVIEDWTGKVFTYEMDTAPVIMNDRTYVPIRFVAEHMGNMTVKWNDGLITISNIHIEPTAEAAAARLSQIRNAPVPAKVERVAINTLGEKYYENQLDVYGVTASGNDGNKEEGAVDLDINTRWSAYGANTLTVDLGDTPQEVAGVAIAMWKGHERIYPFVIEYSTDGENWKTALAKTQNTGESESFEKYMFPEKVTAKYIRYVGDGATDPTKNYCHISEIAILGAE